MSSLYACEPVGAAWLPCGGDLDRCVGTMARWLHDNGKNYDRRALVLPYKGDLNWGGKHPQSYVANKNVGSRKGKHGESGGPVLAFVPDLEILERAIRLADRQVIGVVEHAPGHMEVGLPRRRRSISLRENVTPAYLPKFTKL